MGASPALYDLARMRQISAMLTETTDNSNLKPDNSKPTGAAWAVFRAMRAELRIALRALNAVALFAVSTVVARAWGLARSRAAPT